MYQYIFYILITLNILAYLVMCIDKLKSIYQWWRIPEKTLWILAIIGGVFGIWLAMYWPMYHKAGKREFKLWIPIIGGIWTMAILYVISKL